MDLQDQGVIDSGCSRHMTGNMSYLTDYEEIYGGYVAFGGNPKGGKIIRKGTIKTGNLDFENVYFLIDESQVLLKVPRKNNMYSVDLKNIVPKGGLTCHFAKATSDESKLWHRKLGHLNFKTMNKLVKGNLVRGLPSKLFENDQTCVACQKGKQHRAFFAERRNRTLIEAARTMLADSKLPTTFWAEAVNNACYVQNRVLVVKPHNKTPYELFHSRTPTLSFIRPFGCLVTILNTIDHLGKFNGMADEGFFVGYSLNSKAFRVFNSRTKIVEENLHIRFSENTLNVIGSGPDLLFDIDALTRIMNYEPITVDPPYSQDLKSSQDDESKPSSDDRKKVDEDRRKDSESNAQEKEDNVNNTNNVNAVSTNKVNAFGKKTIIELSFDPSMPALEDVSIFDSLRDDEDDGAEADMNNLDTTIQVSLIPTTRIHKDHPHDQVIGDLQSAIQTRRMSNNLEEHGKNPKSISCIEGSKLDRGYTGRASIIQVTRNLRAWYETLSTYLLDNEFQRGKFDKTLFIKRYKGDILLVQVYVDDIIFGSRKKELCLAFEKLTHEKFQISSMGELIFFLGLQDEDGEEVDVHMYRLMIGSLMYLTSSRPDIMFTMCACARYQVNLKVSHLYAVKRIFSDYSGASIDRKSTTRGCQFLGCRLISWQCKKQTVVANSIIEAEYVATSSCRGQLYLILLGKAKKSVILMMEKLFGMELELILCLSPKTTAWNEFSSTMASAIICLATNQSSGPIKPVADEAVHKERGDRLVRAATTASSLEAEQDSGDIDKTQSKATLNEPSSPGTSSGGGPRCQETMGDTIAQTRVIDLEKIKTTQAEEIVSLKRRVKKLKQKKMSRTHKLKRLRKVGAKESVCG
ncbi:putative ribonuclease H-like domain-containing protein [Tanacetum coccineum]